MIDILTILLIIACADLGLRLLLLREDKRRDDALFRLHRIQGRLMRVIISGVESGTLSRADYDSAWRLMDDLSALSAEFRKRRSWMFNMREFRRFLRDYEQNSGKLSAVKLPDNPELQMIREESGRALVAAFFAHTPFLRSEAALILALRLGAAFFKEQAANFTRPLQDAKRFGVKIGMLGGAKPA